MVQVTHYPHEEESNASEKTTRRRSSENTQRITFRDLDSASMAFKKALEAQDRDLTLKCVEFFDYCLSNKEMILPVLKQLSQIKPPKDVSHCHTPSAPPMHGCTSQNWDQELTDKLRENILLEIDRHAEYILKKKDLDLCYVDVKTIMTRDTLRLSNEILVYDAIKRLVDREKKNKTGSPCTWENLVHCPRYGCMSKVDFSKEPKNNPCLTPEERHSIEQFILKRDSGKNPQPLPHKASQPRMYSNERPHKLSSRPCISSRESSPGSTASKKSKKDKIIINMLSCFTAVFD